MTNTGLLNPEKSESFLLDIRHKPNNQDKEMVDYLYYHNIPFYIVATKTDKLSKSQVNNSMLKLANFINVGKQDIIITSSQNKMGIDNVKNKMESILLNRGMDV
ncbi:MAG: hypothetical protein ACOCRX_11530 [Candidatus Woesearchaeota archaeon]